MSEHGEPAWRRYLRLLRPDVGADVDDELRFHIDMRAREYEASGLDPDAAAQAARARFGDVADVRRWLYTHDRERERAAQSRETMSVLLQHLRHAVRSLRKHPAFTTAVVLTLGLGIGATTAILGVVNAVLLEPLPYADPDRLVGLWHTSPAAPGTLGGQSIGTYVTYRRFNRVLADIGLYERSSVNLTDGGPPERVRSASATASVFSVLGATPLLGRVFTATDEQIGQPPVALLSEGLWRRRFGGDSNVVGRIVQMDKVAIEVIGVMSANLRFPEEGTQLWLPMRLPSTPITGGSFSYDAIARLRPGVTLAGAAADLQVLLPRVPELFPSAAPGLSMEQFLAMIAPRVVVHHLRDDVVGDVGRVLWVILGTIGFVLLAACANVASLFLVRTDGRQRELGVQLALGASRRHVLTRFLAEALILSALGAALGVALASVSLRALRATTTMPIPRIAEIGLDGGVLAVTGLLAVGIALFASALPMLRFAVRDLTPLLRSGGRGATYGRERRRAQRALVVTQVALAFVLLAASTLMARTFVELRRARPGFDAERALVFRMALPASTHPDDASVLRFYDAVRERLARLPGVEAVGVTSWVPLQEDGRSETVVWVEGDDSRRRSSPPVRAIVSASPGYFESLRIPLVSGRGFGARPPERPSDEVVVSAVFAAQALGDSSGRNSIGRRIRLLETAPWLTVVGVVGSVRQAALDREPPAIVYLPFSTLGYGEVLSAYVSRQVGVVVRVRGEPSALSGAVRREVASLDPGLPLFGLAPMRDVVRRSTARTSFTALLLGIAAGVALALGAVGLYGVVAHAVGSRTREIGLRIALGAHPSAVSRLLARQGIVLATVGVGIGVVGAVLVTRVLAALLYGVSPTDPLMLGAAAALLLFVALGASWLPARRAARVDPASVLSAD